MPPEAEARAARHHAEHVRSYALLKAAREKAQKKSGYNSAATRRKLTEECIRRTGLTPYSQQLDLAECMLLGLDVTSIAGTGWGKTLPFALPLFVSPKKIVIIVSPLNALEEDQVSISHE